MRFCFKSVWTPKEPFNAGLMINIIPPNIAFSFTHWNFFIGWEYKKIIGIYEKLIQEYKK